MVKPGRQASPLTVFVRRQAEPEREIPLADVGEVMWSPLKHREVRPLRPWTGVFPPCSSVHQASLRGQIE
jgi:hypothetical protein